MPLISEYEAAALTAMSPELLRWLTGHAPKHGSKRKLKVGKKEGDTVFFNKDELLAFDQWLKQPWPRKNGQRPHIPSAIRREIKDEAGGACVICHSHKDTCEAAHIDPISVTDNNHPENLIWLCANHHAAYDKGFFKPVPDEEEFVASFKTTLRRYRIMLWRVQHQVSHKLFVVLDNCEHLEKELAAATTPQQIKAVKAIAKKTLKQLPALAPVSKTDPKFVAFQSIAADVAALGKGTIAKRLKSARKVRADYVAAFGFVVCPLCRGSGRHDGMDCPVCAGDREIDERDAERVDLRDFEKVDCPVCEGDGVVDGAPCPACGGEARFDRRYADRIDLRDYEKVECPLCDGEGRHDGTDCPVCGGSGEVDRRHLPGIDVEDYKDVDCPLCEGSGRYEERDCPECGGEGRMERRHADRVDLSDYRKVDCPLCEGAGRRDGEDCPVCHGEARIDRRDRDWIDVSLYEIVKCPLCKGKRALHGDDCRVCRGEGEMERRYADNIDPSDYR